MKDYIIILLILFGVSTRISAQKSTSIEFIQKGVEYAQKENYDLAIFYLKLNIKENNIPDSIRVKGVSIYNMPTICPDILISPGIY